MTQLLSPYLIDVLDISKVKSNLAFGATTGLIDVTSNNYLNIVLQNNMTGYNLVVLSRDTQQSGSGVLKAQNFRNPSPLTGATTGSLSNRLITNGGAAQSLFANNSLTYGMQSNTITTGVAGVNSSVAPLGQDAPNGAVIIIAPGASFGISMGGPATGTLGASTTASMEITLVGFIDPA